jgi:hypothetical protein
MNTEPTMNEELFTREGELIAPERRSGPRSYTIRNEPCHRCGGQGGSDAWRHTGWKCYRCGGERFELPRTVKLYSAAELAKLNARRDAIRAKKKAAADAIAAEQAARVAAERTAWDAANGALVAAARPFADRSEFLADLLARLDSGRTLWTQGQIEGVQKSLAGFAERELKAAASEYVGAIGDRVEASVTVENVFSFERPKFNAHWINETVSIVTMRDGKGNVFVSKSPSFFAEKGETFRIKATVKAHDAYRDTKQTVVNRVAIVKPKEKAA